MKTAKSLSRSDLKAIKGGQAITPGGKCSFQGVSVPSTICLTTDCDTAGLATIIGYGIVCGNIGEYCCATLPD